MNYGGVSYGSRPRCGGRERFRLRWCRLIRGMDGLSLYSIRVLIPTEERSKIEVLDDWELRQDFRYIHLDHTLVDLRPAGSNSRNVIQHWRVFPEWALLDIINEFDSRKVHVLGTFSRNRCDFCNVCWIGGVWK